MPRTTPSEKIQTRAARSRLPQRRKPHWLCLRPGALHLGYVRRNVDQAGHWTVRRYNGGGTYKVARLRLKASSWPLRLASLLASAASQ